MTNDEYNSIKYAQYRINKADEVKSKINDYKSLLKAIRKNNRYSIYIEKKYSPRNAITSVDSEYPRIKVNDTWISYNNKEFIDKVSSLLEEMIKNRIRELGEEYKNI